MAENKTTNHNWELIRGDEPLDLRLANRAIQEIDRTLIDIIYPIGSIYCNATDGRNPREIFGAGEWVKCSQGRVLIGEGTSQGDPNGDMTYSAGEECGSRVHTLTRQQIPAHQHPVLTSNGANGDSALFEPQSFSAGRHGAAFGMRTAPNGSRWIHNVQDGTYPTGESHNNLQPYQVVYMWRRTS